VCVCVHMQRSVGEEGARHCSSMLESVRVWNGVQGDGRAYEGV